MKNNIKIFFARSKLRLEVLNYLNTDPQIAVFLSRKMGKHREVISRIFLDLQGVGLAKCSNPQSSSFRYYEITSEGQRFVNGV